MFTKNLRNIKTNDLKKRYSLIRQEKSLPEFSKSFYFNG